MKEQIEERKKRTSARNDREKEREREKEKERKREREETRKSEIRG